MDLKSELLKSIWYAFTSLDTEHSGKVSKSQLKVLSHNLYTALNIPHDPVALEEHFQDNDNGPVSNRGYMPYLNNYILAKVTEGTFNKETFDELCWMMTSKKNLKPSIQQGLCSQTDCFKLFCLFNLLSEDHYPLVIIQSELEYLLKKICNSMNKVYNGKLVKALFSQEMSLKNGITVWEFLEHLSAGRIIQVDSKEIFSLALNDVYMEMYHNILKKGFMLKKGHVRRNWQERWFILKPGIMSYYVSEDLKEKKGEAQLDGSCVVETIPEKEGKPCLFCMKTPGRTYEMSVSDQKQRLEWMQAIQTAARLKAEGKSSLHQELKMRRRELREVTQSSQEDQNNQSNKITSSIQEGTTSQNNQITQEDQVTQISQERPCSRKDTITESRQEGTSNQEDQSRQSLQITQSSQEGQSSQISQEDEISQSSQKDKITECRLKDLSRQEDQSRLSCQITQSSQEGQSSQISQEDEISQSSQKHKITECRLKDLSRQEDQSRLSSQTIQSSQEDKITQSSQKDLSSKTDQSGQSCQITQKSLKDQSIQKSQTDQSSQSSQITENNQNNQNEQSKQSSQSSRNSQTVEVEHLSETQLGEPESKEPEMEIIDIIEHHLEMETQRKEEDARERKKQMEKQRELERQLKEAIDARENLAADLAERQTEIRQQKERIRELVLTQQKLEEALNTEILAHLEEKTIRLDLERQLEAEQKKLKELLLQKHLETPTSPERKHKETSLSLEDGDQRSSSLTSAVTSASLPKSTCDLGQLITGAMEVHQNNLKKMPENHSKAQNMKHWNVQFNRLMKPITPADKMERLPVKSTCPVQGQALTSTEFINKCQTDITQETEFSDSQLPYTDDDSQTQDPPIASECEELQKKDKKQV